MGCQRVRGELLKLGVKVYATTIFAQPSSAEVRALLERVVGQLKGRFGRRRILWGKETRSRAVSRVVVPIWCRLFRTRCRM